MGVAADWVIENVAVATMAAGRDGPPYGAVEDGVVAVRDGQIVWVGSRDQAPVFKGGTVIDGRGGWLTPGLVDCHTHLVYAGHRAEEFAWRCRGDDYEQIARRGGGIRCTVTATRRAGESQLLAESSRRLRRLCEEGVTTVEIKSGYGLDLETELRQLRVARALGARLPVTVITTFLGAHAVPPEFDGRADAYLDFVCAEVLPAVAEQGLADAVDVFCEGIGFSCAQAERLFHAARALNLPVKGHVEQFSSSGGARLVAQCGGLSVDHLEYLPAADVPVLKRQGVVAVLLPGAFYFLRERQLPPVAALRREAVPMAVATDLNPGSAPMASLRLAMNQACVLFGLTPEEALTGVTRYAAQALGLGRRKGQVAAGWDADLVLWEIDHPDQLSYGVNLYPPQRIWWQGGEV